MYVLRERGEAHATGRWPVLIASEDLPRVDALAERSCSCGADLGAQSHTEALSKFAVAQFAARRPRVTEAAPGPHTLMRTPSALTPQWNWEASNEVRNAWRSGSGARLSF